MTIERIHILLSIQMMLTVPFLLFLLCVCHSHESVNTTARKLFGENNTRRGKANNPLACHQECSLFDMSSLMFASDVDYEKLDLNISKDSFLICCLW